MGTNGLVFLYVLFFFKEPRGEVILRKRCKQLAKETVRLLSPSLISQTLTANCEQGRPHYVEGADSDEEGWLQMLKISLSRPLLYLFTEPIVTALSLAIGFVWGTVFLIVSLSLTAADWPELIENFVANRLELFRMYSPNLTASTKGSLTPSSSVASSALPLDALQTFSSKIQCINEPSSTEEVVLSPRFVCTRQVLAVFSSRSLSSASLGRELNSLTSFFEWVLTKFLPTVLAPGFTGLYHVSSSL